MNQALVEYARDHIWVDPKQNRHQRIKPTRLTRDLGATNYVAVMWGHIALPNSMHSFHVYGLGRYQVDGLGLSLNTNTWYALDELQTSSGVLVDVLADNGVLVPPAYTYLYYTDNNYLVLAVAREPLNLGTDVIADSYGESITTDYSLDRHGLTVRFYSNAVAKTNTWKNTASVPETPLSFVTQRIDSSSDYQSYINAVDNMIGFYNGVGLGQYYQDGVLISRPIAFDQSYKGSTFYFRFDETLKDVRDFPIDQTPAFRSRLDTDMDKYLLHSKVNTNGVDYVKDCDFWVGYLNTEGQFKGVQIDPFDQRFIRQVTNNSWSIAHDGVTQATAYHPWLANRTDLTFRVYVRTPAMARGLGQQKNRIADLYRLNYVDQLKVMSGVDSTMPLWQASTLEASSYVKLLGVKYEEITPELVEDVYGYHPITKALARTLYLVEGGGFTVDDGLTIPYDIYTTNTSKQTQRVVFWYDRQGLLLGCSEDNTTEALILVPDQFNNAALAEVVLGNLVSGVGEVDTISELERVIDPYNGYYGYRNYLQDLSNVVGDCIDVTGTDYATYVPANGDTLGYVQWDNARLKSEGYRGITRFASTINVHTLQFNSTSFNGVFETTLSRIDQGQLKPLSVGIGTPTVYMDGRTLLYGLDYHYLNTGQIILVKRPTTEITRCQVVIRCQGWVDPKTNKPFDPLDVGAVKGGVLSHNQIFNDSANKEVKCVIDGRVYHRSQILMAEGGDDNLTGQPINDGYLYGVIDPMALVEPFTTLTTVDSRNTSITYDQQVASYLTSRLVDTDPENSYINQQRHQLYSPIMSYFVTRCMNNTITDKDASNEASLGNMLTVYKPLISDYLTIDPVLTGADLNYVDIAPHPYLTTIAVSALQYAFLQRVNQILLKSTLDLTPYLTINAG